MGFGWGSYSSHEGPYYYGDHKFKLSNHVVSENDRILAVITATEGGAWDNINRYDRCIDTQGLIQWCNRSPQHSVDDIYGALFRRNKALLKPVLDHADSCGYGFERSTGGKHRFFSHKGVAVDTVELQQKMYFLNATGKKGAWDDRSKEYAKAWMREAAKVFKSLEAQAIQRDWTVERLGWFVVGSARRVMDDAPDCAGARAFKAMYMSYAANNPSKASKALETALRSSVVMGLEPWSNDWLAGVAKHLTFDPGIAIYPHRYNKIRPVLEELYDVDLPDFAKELKQWETDNAFRMVSPVELQRALLDLGYDLGPKRADGVAGSKTRGATAAFEKAAGVPEEVQDGLLDTVTYEALQRELEKQGLVALT